MRRKIALILSTTMILTSVLTGCTKDSGDGKSSSSKGGKYKTAKELVEAYVESDQDNMKMNMDLDLNVVMSSEGTEFEIPVTLDGDIDVAGDAYHGNMNMTMEMMGQSQKMSYEMYSAKDGDETIVYTYDENSDKWSKTSNEAVAVDASAIDKMLESDALNKADLSFKNNEYTVKVSIGDIMESANVEDKISEYSDSLSSMGLDEDMVKEIIDALSDSNMVYVFDEDLNLTKISIKDMKYETTIDQDGYTMDLSMELKLTIKCSDFGKVSEDDVTVPDEVVKEAVEADMNDLLEENMY